MKVKTSISPAIQKHINQWVTKAATDIQKEITEDYWQAINEFRQKEVLDLIKRRNHTSTTPLSELRYVKYHELGKKS